MFDGIDNPTDFEKSMFNLERVIENMVANKQPFPRLSFYCGIEDTIAHVSNVRISGKLQHWGVSHKMQLLPGGHTWQLVDRAIRYALLGINGEG